MHMYNRNEKTQVLYVYIQILSNNHIIFKSYYTKAITENRDYRMAFRSDIFEFNSLYIDIEFLLCVLGTPVQNAFQGTLCPTRNFIYDSYSEKCVE